MTVLVLIAASIVVAILAAGLYASLSVFVRAWRGTQPRRASTGPAALSVQTLANLRRWYAGRTCAICRRPIGPIHGEPRPGLLNVATQQTMSWQDFKPDQLSAALETHLPVCADCHMAATFRQHHPDLIVDREPTPHRDTLFH